MKDHGRILILAALLLTVMLAACGKEPEETEGEKTFAVFSYVAAETEERLLTGLSGDRFYYVQSDSAGYELYASNLDTLQQERIYGESDDAEKIHAVMLAASSDNQTALLKYKNGQTDGQPDGAADRAYSVLVLKPDGAVQAEYDVTEYLRGVTRPAAMLLDTAGNVYFILEEENVQILAFDAEGKLQCTLMPEEDGNSQYMERSLFTDGQGRVYYACSSMETAGSKVCVKELLLSEQELKEVWELEPRQSSDIHFAGNQGKILFSEGEILNWLDMESGEKKELLRWMDVNINYGEIQELVLRENGDIGTYRSYIDTGVGKLRYEVTLLRDTAKGGFPADFGGQNQADAADGAEGNSGQAGTSGGTEGAPDSADASGGQEGNSDSAKEQVILTYATMRLDDQMRSRIVEYNKAHTECRIEVKEYGEAGTEEGLLRLNADIAAGNGPDIIDLEQIDVMPYIAKGILADLYPLLDADGEMAREDFVPGILKQYEKDGKLYGIMAGYQLETLMGKEAAVGVPSEWTMERMQQAIAQVQEDGCFVDNLAPQGLLRMLMYMGMGEYLDWENGSCSFDSEEFIRVLELANTMDGKWMDGDMEEYLTSGQVTVNRIYVSDVSEYVSSMRMFGGEKVSCVGFPSAQGGAALVTPFLPLGISGLNGNQEMAWTFVRSFLAEEFQTREVRFNLPIRLSVLQAKIDREAELAAEREQPLTQEELDDIYGMINVPYGNLAYDRNIWKIISEEAEFYFNGAKTAEQVAQTIQSRAEIYISENY